MISRVYRRTGEVVLGKLTLNITSCPENSAEMRKAVGALYTMLLPKLCLIALTLENLSESTFTPVKNYDNNRLNTGILQLSEGTQIVIDETALQQGKLGDQGVRNLRALNDVLTWQKLSYDFTYHQIDFQMDSPSAILSCGKSLFTVRTDMSLNAYNSSAIVEFH
jgi:hypothetical protein